MMPTDPTREALAPPAPSSAGGSGHVARWGFFVVALVLGTALLVSSVTSYLGADKLLDTIVRGQAEGIEDALKLHIAKQGERGLPSAEVLASFVEAYSEHGVRYVGLLGPRGAVLAEAGVNTYEGFLEVEQTWFSGELARATLLLRPPPPRRFASPPGPPPPRGPYERRPPPRSDAFSDGLDPPFDTLSREPGPRPEGGPPRALAPPRVAVEFVPEAALALRARAMRDLGVGMTVALALLLGAAVFWRLSRRAQAAEARLGVQRHLASLGEMSAVLAHEIRNPLASLKGHVQLLAERVVGQQPLERKAARILQETVRLEALTNGLLDFSRTAAVDRVDVDPVAVVRRRAEACGATVAIDESGAPKRWSLDVAKIEQVLDNLLDNAKQAAPQSTIDVAVAARGQHLIIEIRDRGAGVPKEERERIFEPFFTTRTRGTGLGLAICRRVVELHGGTLEVVDRSGPGACFAVTIPRPPAD